MKPELKYSEEPFQSPHSTGEAGSIEIPLCEHEFSFSISFSYEDGQRSQYFIVADDTDYDTPPK